MRSITAMTSAAQPGSASWTGETLTLTYGARGAQLAPPCRGLPARLGEDPTPQPDDRAAALRRLDEPGRAEQPVLGMLPAHQRLGAPHPAVGQAHERLVVQQELAALHSPAQPREQRGPGRLAGVTVRVEHRDAPPSLRLGPRQRHVRGPPDIGGRGRRRARHGDPDARRDLHGAPAHPEREGQRLLDAARHEFDGAGVDDVLHEHRELVAAVADDQVGSGDLMQSRRDLDQQPVTQVVTQRVVHGGEAVEVHDAQPEIDRRGGGEGAAQPLLAVGAVGEERERVLRDDVGHLAAQALLLLTVHAVAQRAGVARGHLVEHDREPRAAVRAEREGDGQPLAQQGERGGQHVLGGVPRAGPLAGQAAAEQLAADRTGPQGPELLVAAGGREPAQQAGEPRAQVGRAAWAPASVAQRPARSATAASSLSPTSAASQSGPHALAPGVLRVEPGQRHGRQPGPIRQAGGTHHGATSRVRPAGPGADRTDCP